MDYGENKGSGMYVGLYDRAHPLPTNGLDLTYIGTGSGDAGDQYTGLGG
jgi:hypothetical protein